MMHAKIIEDPGPGRSEAAEALARCLEQLTLADRNYYRRRSNQEIEAARLASCCEARLAHQELAEAYQLLCGARECQGDPVLAPALSAFLFNPHPAD
jgi:hypothetical protein